MQVGFARVNITPSRGIPVVGYYEKRYASAVLDELEINAVAVASGEEKALLIAMDVLDGGSTAYMRECREKISAATGVPVPAVFIHSTHTHTGPSLDPADDEGEKADMVREYCAFVAKRLVDVSEAAIEDLKEAQMSCGMGKAPNIAFIRRYRMKDGSVRTNPGVNNPDIVGPIGEVDERVHVIRFDRADGSKIAVVNFGDHPDTIGGTKISGDWPAFARRTVEKVLDNTKCILFNGAQGDVNHVNVHPTGGSLNGMFRDFDAVSRGYTHSRYMGRVVTGAVLQAWDKAENLEDTEIRYLEKTVNIPSNMPTANDDMKEAHRINDLYLAGRIDEVPYEGMMKTTVMAKAHRLVKLEHGPEFFPMSFDAVAIGKVAFIGVPGEPFGAIGQALKKAEGWKTVCPCCLVNGTEGYFPMKDSYEEGGYEASSSRFKEGTAELIIEEGTAMLDALKK